MYDQHGLEMVRGGKERGLAVLIEIKTMGEAVTESRRAFLVTPASNLIGAGREDKKEENDDSGYRELSRASTTWVVPFSAITSAEPYFHAQRCLACDRQ